MSLLSPEDVTVTRAMLQEYLGQYPVTPTNDELREWIIGHGVTDEIEIEKFVGDRHSYV